MGWSIEGWVARLVFVRRVDLTKLQDTDWERTVCEEYDRLRDRFSTIGAN